jgi:DNA-binding MurR/RpiR family transcriptional regulator
LKAKYASGEIKPGTNRVARPKGFKHSAETKEKIRQSLKKKWATDSEYQEKMKKSVDKNSSSKVRQKNIHHTQRQMERPCLS